MARESSFSGAARSLFVSQPALSQRVRRLEERLGVQLFLRSTTTVRLTPAGDLLLDRAVRLLTAWQDLEGRFTGEPVAPRLRVAATYGYDGALEEHLTSQAPVRDLVLTGPDRAQQMLQSDEVDAAFTYLLPPVARHPGTTVRGGLHVITIVQEPVWVVVSRAHPLVHSRSVTLDDLHEAGTEWLIGAPHEPMRRWELALLSTASQRPRLVTTTSNVLLRAERGEVAGLGSPSGGPSTSSRTALPLIPEVAIHHVLLWRSERMTEQRAWDLVVALRTFHRTRALQHRRYWDHIMANRERFPGVGF